MDANEYQRLASRTIRSDMDKSSMEYHAVFGMNSEAGEIAGIYQKRFQGHSDTDEHLLKEAGDLLWFVAELCTAKGVTLSSVMETNIEKLRNRYPAGFSAENSLHRSIGDI